MCEGAPGLRPPWSLARLRFPDLKGNDPADVAEFYHVAVKLVGASGLHGVD